MSEEVLELSIEESNKLRAKLGLAPLRINGQKTSTDDNDISSSGQDVPVEGKEKEQLELSVDDTNALRATLGLKPLNSSARKEIIYAPAENMGAKQETSKRIERARLARESKAGATKTFGTGTLADQTEDSALSWAEKMRVQSQTQPIGNSSIASTKKKRKSKRLQKLDKSKVPESYQEEDLNGMQVAHNMVDLEAGSTTVLTMADASILEKNSESNRATGLNEGDVALENVNLSEQKKQEDGLRKKRQLEMGMGRVGGYAGFDDDEFEELGGTLDAAPIARGSLLRGGNSTDSRQGAKGFRIGSSTTTDGQTMESLSDFDKIQAGRAVSLQSGKADVTANDYMTIEEEEAERSKKKTKKNGEFKKSKKKKKDKKKRRTTVVDSEEEDEKDTPHNQRSVNLMEHLEKTATPSTSSGLRKRHRVDSDDDEDPKNISPASEAIPNNSSAAGKRMKFDKAMEKGNERTRLAFADAKSKAKIEEEELDDDPDDSFLNAALAKARRLNRLRDMRKEDNNKTGADVVAEAVKSINTNMPVTSGVGTMSFSVDDTREFTLALKAREQQKARELEKAKQVKLKASSIVIAGLKQETTVQPKVETAAESEGEEDVDMEALAKEIKPDQLDSGWDGTAENAGVGRGLSSFVSMLKTTGEIKGQQKREELRGRAKDERNYDNYQPLDLDKVVKIGRNATDKDLEMASREISLEYRDEHGRLLTEKAAWRDLCKQFHGHGSGKRKEDKKLKQIAREQAEARMASSQVAAARDGKVSSSLGALKATQKATGKAFVVHKT